MLSKSAIKLPIHASLMHNLHRPKPTRFVSHNIRLIYDLNIDLNNNIRNFNMATKYVTS